MNLRKIRADPVLIFDLGNVVNEFVGVKEVQRMWRPELTLDEVKHKWLTSPAVIGLEIGKVDANDFAREFIEEWCVPVSSVEFLKLFVSWVRPPFPDIENLLAELRSSFRVACLSNTCAIHWQRMGSEFGLSGYFDHHYLSFQMGLVKPSRAIYTAVIEDLGVNADDIIFFDDTSENIESACEVGINGHVVDGVVSLREKCRALNLL